MITTVPEVREHLNITGTQDDALLGRLAGAAQELIERQLGFKIEDSYGGESQGPVPEALKQAVRMLVGHWYENREASVVGVAAQPLPMGVDAIVSEFRCYSFGG